MDSPQRGKGLVPLVAAGLWYRPGRASDYIEYYDEFAWDKKDLEVVVYCRVSKRQQQYHGNLDDQRRYVCEWVTESGASIVGVYSEVLHGWEERPALWEAAKFAREHGAILVAESTDRFIRSPDSEKVAQDAWPTYGEFASLQSLTWDVALATLVHPDTQWTEVKRHHSRRGQASKGKKGGRPRKRAPGDKKKRREELMPQVLQMRRDGMSFRECEKAFGVAHTTIRDWCVGRY